MRVRVLTTPNGRVIAIAEINSPRAEGYGGLIAKNDQVDYELDVPPELSNLLLLDGAHLRRNLHVELTEGMPKFVQK
jgi:hypothetical protein